MKTRVIWFLTMIALSACLAATGRAQTYPDRTVRIISPYPAGGSVDAVGRIVGEKMQKIWGEPVIIEDIVGAAGMTGTPIFGSEIDRRGAVIRGGG